MARASITKAGNHRLNLKPEETAALRAVLVKVDPRSLKGAKRAEEMDTLLEGIYVALDSLTGPEEDRQSPFRDFEQAPGVLLPVG